MPDMQPIANIIEEHRRRWCGHQQRTWNNDKQNIRSRERTKKNANDREDNSRIVD